MLTTHERKRLRWAQTGFFGPFSLWKAYCRLLIGRALTDEEAYEAMRC